MKRVFFPHNKFSMSSMAQPGLYFEVAFGRKMLIQYELNILRFSNWTFDFVIVIGI